MEATSVLCILVGVLIVCLRAPQIVAPHATLRWLERFLARDRNLRAAGLALAPLGVALVVFADAGSAADLLLRALGFVLLAGMLWLVVAPDTYRRIARGVMAGFEGSPHALPVRVLGVIGVLIGGLLIYAGLFWV